ncbi:hypothetical protein PTSG_03924 [Salpingoeca rosetta]|uniref:3-dehydrosphinganine reductase n=1 Tax=Salpingoeca rosetta (strain ATCC 50818 / BSB-021) TaxID=946362 RepID=F2U799_SALR5|nr:uncharacterized protein PTSG_03924 [Salpingoeca rosetta]EGD83316.1 hypothetical protein PTSG_03924 [Salpingoeca rosetta]|eukprot:XP_004994820.1 hypothetical protein PTSG_03924 [Salpingoeca rosetta]
MFGCGGCCWTLAAVGAAVLVVVNWLWNKITAPGIDAKDKHVFITGGTTGLGLGIAIKFAKRGARVTIVSRSQKNVDTGLKAIRDAVPSAKAQGFPCDVTNEKQMNEAVQQADEQFGPVKYLICSAGLAKPGYFLETPTSVYRQQMDLNYFGCLHAAKAAVPSMKKSGGGTVVFVSSAVVFAGMVGYSQYAPSKYALRGLTDCLRNELLPYNIRVVGYYPSNMDTPGFEEETRTKPVETQEIEGQASLITADVAAEHLMTGLANGSYSITNELMTELARIGTVGVAPRENSMLELLVIPLLVPIGKIFGLIMDHTARKGPGTSKKTK